MPYQEILSRAWQTLKRQPALWLFGLLSACAGGTYGRIALPSFNFQTPSFSSPGTIGHGSPNIPPELEHWLHALSTIPERTWVLIALGFLTLLLVWLVVMLAVRAIADPSLLRGILSDIRDGHPLTTSEVFNEGKRFFWRMVGFALLIGGSAVLLAIIFSLLTLVLTFATFGVGLLCLIPLIILAIPFIWLVELYLEMARLALVVEDLPLLASFSRGWEVLKNNFWNAVVMGVLLTAIHLGVGIALGALFVGIVIVVLVGLALLAALSAAAGSFLPVIFVGILAGFIVFVLYLFLLGLLQTYLQSAWVLAYLHFIGGEPQPQETTSPAGAPAAPESTADAPPTDRAAAFRAA